MIAKKQTPPIFFCIIGLAVFLAWLLLVIQQSKSFNLAQPVNALLQTFAKNAVYWKPFTIISFVLGIKLYMHSNKKISHTYLSNKHVFIAISTILFILVLTAFVSNITIIEAPFLMLTQENFIAGTALPLLYGLICLVVGIWAGKNKWLSEYHFYYNELKTIFMYSIALYIFWFLLKLFKIYSFITEGIIGQIIYMIDALTINLLLVFIYMFALVFLENYRFGKRLLIIFEWMGRNWYWSAIVLSILQLFILKFEL